MKYILKNKLIILIVLGFSYLHGTVLIKATNDTEHLNAIFTKDFNYLNFTFNSYYNPIFGSLGIGIPKQLTSYEMKMDRINYEKFILLLKKIKKWSLIAKSDKVNLTKEVGQIHFDNKVNSKEAYAFTRNLDTEITYSLRLVFLSENNGVSTGAKMEIIAKVTNTKNPYSIFGSREQKQFDMMFFTAKYQRLLSYLSNEIDKKHNQEEVLNKFN